MLAPFCATTRCASGVFGVFGASTRSLRAVLGLVMVCAEARRICKDLRGPTCHKGLSRGTGTITTLIYIYYHILIKCYTILYTILFYTILFYTILYTILYYSILYYTILYYTETLLFLYYDTASLIAIGQAFLGGESAFMTMA